MPAEGCAVSYEIGGRSGAGLQDGVCRAACRRASHRRAAHGRHRAARGRHHDTSSRRHDTRSRCYRATRRRASCGCACHRAARRCAIRRHNACCRYADRGHAATATTTRPLPQATVAGSIHCLRRATADRSADCGRSQRHGCLRRGMRAA